MVRSLAVLSFAILLIAGLSHTPDPLPEMPSGPAPKTADAGPDYLSAQTIQWVRVHPADRRAPEALYWAVRTSRLGCTDEETGRYSRQAFDLLKTRYAGAEWARQNQILVQVTME